MKILVLSLILVMTIVGCKPTDKNMRNLSTQTRVRDDNVNNRFMNNNNPLNTRDGVNNLNDGMVRNNNNLDGDPLRNNANLNNGMTRPNTNLSTNLSNMSDRATTIAQRVTALPEINNASVLISGNTAIVGCSVNGDTTNKITNALKQKVEAAVKVADRNIQNISVTSDPNIYTRIQTMSKDMNTNNNRNDGNPATNFTKDIEDILEQITNIR